MEFDDFSNNKVLIIEDEIDNIKLVDDILKLKNIHSIAAQNGIDGVVIADQIQPDLILLDLRLPGLDGFSVHQQLKENPTTCNIPVIVMTGISDIESKLQAFNEGCVDYLTKPFRRPELLARVCVHLKLVNMQNSLANHNSKLEDAINTAKSVNMAIGVLMERENISDEKAYEKIRSQARDERRKVSELAAEILATVSEKMHI